MPNISLDSNLNPGNYIEFMIEMNIFGEEVDDVLNFTVPQAPPLMNKVKGIKLIVENKDEYKLGNNKTFNFNKYYKKENVSSGRYKFLMVLTNPKGVGNLAPDDDVIINCSDAGFTDVNAIIMRVDNQKKNYVYVSIDKDIQPSPTSDSTTSGTVQEYKKKIKTRKVTVQLPPSIIGDSKTGKVPSLISEVSTPPKKGNIEDIVVFTYKQFNGPNKASIKYKLMDDSESEINLKNPPPRSDVVKFRGKESHSKSFTLNDEKGEKVLCYVAIARYRYDGDNWKGEWLQTNDSDNVIFGKAE
jgi:hypothetical protein